MQAAVHIVAAAILQHCSTHACPPRPSKLQLKAGTAASSTAPVRAVTLPLLAAAALGMGAAPAKPKSRERVWVTGASGGLGEEVAAAYAARGCAVVLSARRRRELDRVAARCREAGAPTAEVVPLDQGDAASIERALRGALKAPLDVAVLCGGVGSRAAALDTDAATLRRLMETNFLATAELGRRCARHFLDCRRDGRIVVVCVEIKLCGACTRLTG